MNSRFANTAAALAATTAQAQEPPAPPATPAPEPCQQRLGDADAALGGEQDDDEDELGEHEAQDGAGVVGGGGGVDDGVDDQLAEVGDRGREHAGDEGEAGEHEGERSTRRPHQLERAAAVTKYAEEAAQAGLVRWVCHAGEGASKPRGSDNFSAR